MITKFLQDSDRHTGLRQICKNVKDVNDCKEPTYLHFQKKQTKKNHNDKKYDNSERGLETRPIWNVFQLKFLM